MTEAISYRRDVDGLRAVAILAVLLYHFDVPVFSGGFVGVDIFFTISGYLIGSIVLRQVTEGKFSFAEFYARRVRRLFPAALAMVIATSIAAHLLLLPFDYREFGQSVLASLLYASNVLFYMEAGYFDLSSHSKPLLHTWSLSVEEQFYLVFPLLAWLLVRHIKWVLVVLTVASLAAAQYYVAKDPSAAFYLYPFRAWEMFLGVGLAAYQLSGRKLAPSNALAATSMGLVGIALMVVPVIVYDHATPFPGITALAPCAGAALCIAAGTRSDSLVGKLLSTAPMVFIGQISYSLYLWHWPVMVLYGYSQPDALVWQETLMLMLLTLLLSWASWKYIENPFRKPHGTASRPVRTLAIAAACSIVPIAYGLLLHQTRGLPTRLEPETARIAEAAADFLRDFSGCVPTSNTRLPGVEHCIAGNPDESEGTVVVWGDSHAAAMKVGFVEHAAKLGRDALIFWKAGCPPAIGIEKFESVSNAAENASCTTQNEAVLSWMLKQQNIESVVLVGRWSYYTSGTGVGIDRQNAIRLAALDKTDASVDQAQILTNALDATIRQLASHGVKVYLLEQVPEFVNFRSANFARGLMSKNIEPEVVRRSVVIPRTELDARQGRMEAYLDQLAASGQATVLRTHERFCGEHECNLLVDGLPAYFDNNHVTAMGSRKLQDVFDPVLRPRGRFE